SFLLRLFGGSLGCCCGGGLAARGARFASRLFGNGWFLGSRLGCGRLGDAFHGLLGDRIGLGIGGFRRSGLAGAAGPLRLFGRGFLGDRLVLCDDGFRGGIGGRDILGHLGVTLLDRVHRLGVAGFGIFSGNGAIDGTLVAAAAATATTAALAGVIVVILGGLGVRLVLGIAGFGVGRRDFGGLDGITIGAAATAAAAATAIAAFVALDGCLLTGGFGLLFVFGFLDVQIVIVLDGSGIGADVLD